MSTWRGKALDLFPEFRQRILATDDRLDLWRDIERELHAALRREDHHMIARCFRYAVWTLHPTPQARTLADVSTSAARLLHRHADELHRWIDRYDFMQAQKGLRLHLGDEAYAEFEARFLEKTRGYPRQRKSNQTVQRTGASRSSHSRNRTSSAAGSRRLPSRYAKEAEHEGERLRISPCADF
jgi:hypothetical protein